MDRNEIMLIVGGVSFVGVATLALAWRGLVDGDNGDGGDGDTGAGTGIETGDTGAGTGIETGGTETSISDIFDPDTGQMSDKDVVEGEETDTALGRGTVLCVADGVSISELPEGSQWGYSVEGLKGMAETGARTLDDLLAMFCAWHGQGRLSSEQLNSLEECLVAEHGIDSSRFYPCPSAKGAPVIDEWDAIR